LRAAPERSRAPAIPAAAALGLDHHVVVLDADRHGLGDIRPGHQPRARLHRDRIGTRTHAGGIAPGLTGADVELPAVPGATDDLARAGVAVVARPVRFHETGLLALAQAAAAMRTAVVEREELAAEIEHHDGAPVHLREPAGAGRNVADRGDHMLGHGSSRLWPSIEPVERLGVAAVDLVAALLAQARRQREKRI